MRRKASILPEDEGRSCWPRLLPFFSIAYPLAYGVLLFNGLGNGFWITHRGGGARRGMTCGYVSSSLQYWDAEWFRHDGSGDISHILSVAREEEEEGFFLRARMVESSTRAAEREEDTMGNRVFHLSSAWALPIDSNIRSFCTSRL